MNNVPVAWMSSVNGETVYVGYEPADGWLAIPLYTHPAKTLTDEEINQIYRDVKADSLFEQTFPYRFAHAIQVALGVKQTLQPNSGLGGIALKKAQEK